MKKKMAIMGISLATMLMFSNVYAENTLQYGQETEIQTDSGSYKVTIDKIIETDQFNSDDQSAKIVCVDCVIENVDYKNYDNLLSAYNVGTGEVALLDSDGISAEFYDVATTSRDGYEFSAHIKPGEKKKVALPFLVSEDTESVTVKIDSKYTIDQKLGEENDNDSDVEDDSNVESSDSDIESRLSALEENTKELEEKNKELESQYNDLKDENESLKKKNKKLKKQVKELQASQSETNTEKTTQEETTAATEVEETEVPEEAAQPVTEYQDATTIRIVQQALNEAGYNCGTPDGLAGGKTTEAITSYQTAKGITVNGLVTDELIQSLGVVEKVQEAVKAEASKGEYGSGYTYDQLARNPDTYMGQKIKISGKVLQAETSGTTCYARIAMNSSYDTVIFVTYDASLLGYRLLEDDQVTVYGTSYGVYSYEAVSGATITIPWIHADIIEM